jgi:hypothetical protein
MSPYDAHCHLPRPQLDRAGCNVGEDIMRQSAGLALAALAVAQQNRLLRA